MACNRILDAYQKYKHRCIDVSIDISPPLTDDPKYLCISFKKSVVTTFGVCIL